jgi:hypothetical protein
VTAYLWRLVCISLASFFLVHLAASLLVLWSAPAAIRLAARMRPSSAARLLLAIRAFPCLFAILVVASLCVPSYIWLEPDSPGEKTGWLCLVAAALSLWIWTVSLSRGARAVFGSIRYLGHCRQTADEIVLPEQPSKAWIVQSGSHIVGLAGIFTPQIMIRKDVLAALSPRQLDAALRHEWAHAESRDNLKKLLFFLLPDALPFARSRLLEDLIRSWAKFAEWAADDRATAGDPESSLSLADALIRVARLGIPSAAPPLTTSLIAESSELAVRVTRLLDPRPMEQRRFPQSRLLLAGVAVIGLAALPLLGPLALHTAHDLLELLVQ